MSPWAAAKALVGRFINRAPEPSTGTVRVDGDDKTLGVSTEWAESTVDWTDLISPPVESGWTTEELDMGNIAFRAVVTETADQVRNSGIFDGEIWEAIHGGESIEAAVVHGRLTEKYPHWRVSTTEAWEKFGSKIPVGEIPIMMAREGYGQYDALWRIGAGEGCGMAILVSDDATLRAQWLEAVGAGLDAHWPGMIMGVVLSDKVAKSTLDSNRNRGLLPVKGEGAARALHDFRLGKGYPEKRILIADLGRVGRKNTSLVGQIVAAAKEGKKSGNVGVVATMSVADYVAWQKSTNKYWSSALDQAGLVVGGLTDMDAAEQVARAYSGDKNPALAARLMGLDQTKVAMLAGVDRVIEGWILCKR